MKIMLLGDSIRLGYAPYVASILGPPHTVCSNNDNGRFTLYTLRYLHEWARECTGEIDIVHWNNGLWDAARHTFDNKPLTSLADYGENLRRMIIEIRGLFPSAKIVFALTTPVHPSHPDIRNADIEQMNTVACGVMSEHGIPVNDLFSVVQNNSVFISDDLIHLSAAGYQALGKAVVRACTAACDTRSC